MQQNVRNWSIEWGGRVLSIEVGKLALQADASCTVRYGDTVILATVVMSESERAGIDFFPLMVDFEERLYAAGKIKGSRFVKREGRPSDEAVLSGRLVDRTIRPLFDERLRRDVQVVLTALSVDSENDAAIVSLIAASCVLSISRIPWNGPIAGARIGRAQNEFLLNATMTQLEQSDLDIVVAGTSEKLIMTEAGAKEVPEATVFASIAWGLEQLHPVVELLRKIQDEVGDEKLKVEDLVSQDSPEEQIKNRVRAFVFSKADTHIFDSVKITRKDRKAMIEKIKKQTKEMLLEEQFDEDLWSLGLQNIKSYVAEVITERILKNNQRLDGRKLDEIRSLSAEVDLLPRVHGSGLFMRGDTQVLSVVTLGAPGDVQTLETMETEGTKRYMHHYNDAPYTYGEAQPMRGPSRRAVGHGALAERALEPVLPNEEIFPYTIRVVSEVLGSNGSSSMASTCGSTLSLMAAGVPITKPVAGIAMGLASNNEGASKVLTDLQDVEDGPGGMDFKIAGTVDGITAIQMDTKTQGLSFALIEETLQKARIARLQILDMMRDCIANPRAELSAYAPRIEIMMINPEKIGDVIGPGGKIIKKIIEDTGVSIDIENDGRVLITSVDVAAMEKAKDIVKSLTHEVTAGEMYEGKVVRLEDFGAFVQISPNKDGLVHVSEISWERVERPSSVLKLGDVVKVKVKEIDNLGRVNLSMKALIPRPENYVEPAKTFGQNGMGPKKFGFNRGQRPQRPPR